MAIEVNFDGLVGPSHHYGGLSFGNIASAVNQGTSSSPKDAALQGLEKIRALARLGVAQAILPPHMRPDLALARRLGFSGTDAQVLEHLGKDAPLLLAACSSASSMWTANAATVSPSADSEDGRLHITPANLQNKLHRSIEPPTTARILWRIFTDPELFVHHEPLPATAALGDEGAANHTRFAPNHGARGVQLFVFGESAALPGSARPTVFPARQTRESSEGIARLHQIPASRVVFAQQNPDAIDRGVFHNDVISVGHLETYFFHEAAFVDTRAIIEELTRKYSEVTGRSLRLISVSEADLSVSTAVSTYLFNSQIVVSRAGKTLLIAPKECEENEAARAVVRRLTEDGGPFDEVQYFDLRQSMHGGGGPACLRLRVVLTERELASINPRVLFTDALDEKLQSWIARHYRDRLSPVDLVDPALMEESRVALDELTGLLGLGSIYPFQIDPRTDS